MNSWTASNARANFFQIIKEISKNSLPTRITSKEGNLILMTEEDYESLMETAELISIPGLVKSVKKSDEEIKKGDIIEFHELFDCEE